MPAYGYLIEAVKTIKKFVKTIRYCTWPRLHYRGVIKSFESEVNNDAQS